MKTRRIDIHAHYFPERYIAALETEGCKCGACVTRDPRGPILDAGPLHAGPLERRFIDLDLRIADMDRQGVDIQALSLTQPMVYFADAPVARALSVAFNDSLVEAHEQFPDRLVGLGMIPANHLSEGLAELERIKDAPGMCGVYMGTAIGDWDLSDERLLPIFERIEDMGWPIFLHPLKVVGMTDRLQPYFLSNLLGNPFDTAIAAAHLIFSGVMDRFPNLDIVLPHAGGAFSFLAGRLDHGWRMGRPELKHMENGALSYLRRFHYDTIAHSDASLAFVIDQVGADRVMLGSDYCFDMGHDAPVDIVEQHAPLNTSDRSAILGGTAASLLKLQ
ncbi:aminocarboxymuconate-semialdehyde decarboxylase [Roseinatronobacter thiooxidans]|uniref:Aminocarboxymuconate-semialdehyde decarboxylase n=1 Tax=Roseinatronobacter thiooxidans TaxID=121821 RepID=A0A2W7PKH0_9RHOB|nr:amidohydrolase family protein [Roseinatronobacter thiooxidans]PZX36768.1 aminocarboxymuconate-semialdehyde decarboxylase [Roseinatronobacter thiooxidans]